MEEDRKIIQVLDRMRALCSRREYCTEDIRRKTVQALPDYDSEVADRIIGVLKRDKYIDDLRYASAFARDKSSISGWGKTKIRYALGAKRIARDVIDEALGEVDAAKASERLVKLVSNKYASLENDPAWRTKLLRFALGRGYDYDEIMAVLSTLHPSP